MTTVTRVAGWLDAGRNLFSFHESRLENARNTFKYLYRKQTICRWVCEDTTLCMGGNTNWLFIGTNADFDISHDAITWIQFLLQYFEKTEGRVDIQEIQDSKIIRSKFLLIKDGAIQENCINTPWCEGRAETQ
jgi:hypothetical protein